MWKFCPKNAATLPLLARSFSALALLTGGGLQKSVVSCPVCGRAFRRIPSLYLEEMPAAPPLTPRGCDNQNCLQVLPGEQNYPQLRTTALAKKREDSTQRSFICEKPGQF